jgi:hypothetical protein
MQPTLDDGAAEEPGVLQTARRGISRSAHADTPIVSEAEVPPPEEERGRLTKVPQSAREPVVLACHDIDAILREVRSEVRCCITSIIRELREVSVERLPSISGELAGSPRRNSRKCGRGSEKESMFAGHH